MLLNRAFVMVGFCVVAFGAILAYERYQDWQRKIHRPTIELIIEIDSFRHFWAERSGVANEAPDIQTRAETLEWLRVTDVWDASRRWPHILSGVDPWGFPLVFEIKRYRDDPCSLIMLIRSIGPNGIDEHGGGDDIEKQTADYRFPPKGGYDAESLGDLHDNRREH